MSVAKVRAARRCEGVALLELMLALGLGTFMILVGVSVYQNLAKQHVSSEERFTMLTSATIVERLLHDELHLKIGHPCGAGQLINLVTDGEDTYWLDIFNRPIQIYAGDEAGAEDIRALGADAGDRVSGSDVVVALTYTQPTAVSEHNEGGGYFDVFSAADFERGGFAIVCDDQAGALFQITDLSAGRLRVGYAAGNVTPGNCAERFDFSAPCSGSGTYRFAPNALIAPLRPVVLFVGVAPAGERRSLYRERLSLRNYGGRIAASMRREEILGGIAALRASRVTTGAAQGLDIGILAAGSQRRLTGALPHLLGRPIAAGLTDNTFLSHEFSLSAF